MSTGTNILEVTIDTTKEQALIGMDNHLYNANGAFLSLSKNPKCIKITVQILDEAWPSKRFFEFHIARSRMKFTMK